VRCTGFGFAGVAAGGGVRGGVDAATTGDAALVDSVGVGVGDGAAVGVPASLQAAKAPTSVTVTAAVRIAPTGLA